MPVPTRLLSLLCLALWLVSGCAAPEDLDFADVTMRDELCREAFTGPQDCYWSEVPGPQ